VKRALTTLLLAAAGAAATVAALPAAGLATTPAAVDPVVDWNRFVLAVQSTPGEQPATVHPTYELAIVHAAISDAVVAIDRSATPYIATVHAPRRASVAAAADAAAHDTLVALYPGLRAAIDREYAALLGALPVDRHTSQGIRVGRAVAAQILARRANDGSGAPLIPFQPGSAPGDYQLTPPALTSPRYAEAHTEAKRLGVAQGSTRTPDQTQIGVFWNPAIWATWNRIAQSAALARPGTLSQEARAFATLNVTIADAVIGFYDAKYTYRLWRPVTAIRSADTDGNPDTAADPNWSPLSATAPDPSYPGAHGTISAAGAAVLASIYGDDVPFTVTSSALPGVERSFAGFSEAAEEATVSRIYNGNHTRIDQVAGASLGRDVAGFVLRRDGR
jgi:hypothetical protein